MWNACAHQALCYTPENMMREERGQGSHRRVAILGMVLNKQVNHYMKKIISGHGRDHV